MKRLREIRREQKLSVARLAARVGCDPSLIARIERREIQPSRWTALKIANALGVAESELAEAAP